MDVKEKRKRRRTKDTQVFTDWRNVKASSRPPVLNGWWVKCRVKEKKILNSFFSLHIALTNSFFYFIKLNHRKIPYCLLCVVVSLSLTFNSFSHSLSLSKALEKSNLSIIYNYQRAIFLFICIYIPQYSFIISTWRRVQCKKHVSFMQKFATTKNDGRSIVKNVKIHTIV